jgi:hypothetical protein
MQCGEMHMSDDGITASTVAADLETDQKIQAQVYSNVIRRADLHVPDDYAPWASGFAIVTSDFIKEVSNRIAYASKRALLASGWRRERIRIQECYIDWMKTDEATGTDCFFLIEKYVRGWIIEIRPEGFFGPEARVLTDTFYSFPILTPRFQEAVRLLRAIRREHEINYPIDWRPIYS